MNAQSTAGKPPNVSLLYTTFDSNSCPHCETDKLMPLVRPREFRLMEYEGKPQDMRTLKQKKITGYNEAAATLRRSVSEKIAANRKSRKRTEKACIRIEDTPQIFKIVGKALSDRMHSPYVIHYKPLSRRSRHMDAKPHVGTCTVDSHCLPTPEMQPLRRTKTVGSGACGRVSFGMGSSPYSNRFVSYPRICHAVQTRNTRLTPPKVSTSRSRPPT